MDEDPKAVSKSVSMVPVLWEKIDTIIRAGEFSNRSDYIRRLVMDDLLRRSGPVPLRDNENYPDAMQEGIMVYLTEELLGKLDGEVIQNALDGFDQRVILRNLLRDYLAKLPVESMAAEAPKKRLRQLPPHDKDLPA